MSNEAISRLYDDVAELVLAQYPDARIRGEMYANDGPKLTIQISTYPNVGPMTSSGSSQTEDHWTSHAGRVRVRVV